MTTIGQIKDAECYFEVFNIFVQTNQQQSTGMRKSNN